MISGGGGWSDAERVGEVEYGSGVGSGDIGERSWERRREGEESEERSTFPVSWAQLTVTR